jgi:hypothetical protein
MKIYHIFHMTFLEELGCCMMLVVSAGLASLYQRRHCHVKEVRQSQMEGLV